MRLYKKIPQRIYVQKSKQDSKKKGFVTDTVDVLKS